MATPHFTYFHYIPCLAGRLCNLVDMLDCQALAVTSTEQVVKLQFNLSSQLAICFFLTIPPKQDYSLL